jgi:HPt (histidine-containing phosphotransfer) domain-containing protein
MSAEPVDLDTLRAYIGSDPRDVSASVALFFQSAALARTELAEADGRGDAATAGAVAHRFKSVARYLGANALAALCERIEVAGRAADLAGIRRERPALDLELDRVMAALTPLMQDGGSAQ